MPGRPPGDDNAGGDVLRAIVQAAAGELYVPDFDDVGAEFECFVALAAFDAYFECRGDLLLFPRGQFLLANKERDAESSVSSWLSFLQCYTESNVDNVGSPSDAETLPQCLLDPA